MTGIIDVGGGLRGIYGAGVFDRCLDDEISFDVCIGVSAGSANITSFLSKQKKRNYPFYVDYPSRKEYMGLQNVFKHGSYLNLRYIYGELSREGGENAVDYDTFSSYNGKMFVVATDGKTGEPVYFTGEDMKRNDYSPLVASSTLPVFCPACKFRGISCYDGGLADPVPIEKAFSEGCDKVVLILTRHRDFVLPRKRDISGAVMLFPVYPGASKCLINRKELYSREIALAKKYEKEGKCLIIAPDEKDTEGIGTLTKDKKKLTALYEKGYSDAGRIKEFVFGCQPLK